MSTRSTPSRSSKKQKQSGGAESEEDRSGSGTGTPRRSGRHSVQSTPSHAALQSPVSSASRRPSRASNRNAEDEGSESTDIADPETPGSRAKRSRKDTPVRTPGSGRSKGTVNADDRSPPLRDMPDLSDTYDEPSTVTSSIIDHGTDGDIDLVGSPLHYEDALRTPKSTSSHVRQRYRPDIGSTTRHHRQVEMDDGTGMEPLDTSHGGPPSEPGSQTAQPGSVQSIDGPRVVIWGTNICVQEVQRKFKNFLQTFVEENPDEDELMTEDLDSSRNPGFRLMPFYLKRLREVGEVQGNHVSLNLQHVKSVDERLYRQIITYPAEIIPYLDMTLTEVLEEHYPDCVIREQVMVRPYNAIKTRNMRSLNPEDIDQLITVTGMIIRTSNLIPEMRAGFFECSVCKNHVESEVDRGRIEEPTLCQNCNTNHSFTLIHNRSSFMDKQVVKLQEAPEDMPAGQTPHTVTLFAHGDLVDTVQPGDRVTVTGIFRAVPIRVNPRMRTVKAVYRTYLDVLHYRKTDVHRLHQQKDGSQLSKERVEQIMKLSKKTDIYERLAHALAPSIYEHEDIKKGILLLLFGGTRKDLASAGRGKFRSEINMLLCGDPGTSKSQLLQYVHKMVPRGQYTSGKGTSAVGLTAAVTRDTDTKQLVLQTGSLVLSDNGVCCIDEFDKMNDVTRSILHEVMEQQTMSIAKAGIICQLNARTSILAAANPVDSEWNKKKTIIENVQLPHTLLSRFDLIFLMLDPQDELYDRRLATHLVSLYYQSSEEAQEEFVDMGLIRDYIMYAKAHCHPKLTETACQNLIDKYVKMRRVGSSRGQISAFPRQLESLIRLSEAHAKLRLNDFVEDSHVEEAFRLHREALKQSAIDPVTGLVDPGMLTSGLSSSIRRQVQEIGQIIRAKLEKLPYGIHSKQLLAELRKDSDQMLRKELFDDAVNELVRQDMVVRDAGNRIKILHRAQGTADGADSMAMG